MTKNKTDIWMPIYVGDYLSDTMHLTTEQHGAYFLLLLAYWKNRGPLPINRLKNIVNIKNDSWIIIEDFFDVVLLPGFWVHNRVEKELELAVIRRQAAENRGKKGMEARWKDKKKDSSTIVEGIVEGIVGDSSSPSPSPSLIKKEKEKEKTLAVIENEFKIFYDKYPNRKGPQGALKKWMSLAKSNKLPPLDKILTAIEQQVLWRTNANGAFRPEWKHPSAWLNQGCWDDEVQTKPKINTDIFN